MKRLSDKILAERILQARQHGGYRVPLFIRMNAKGYLFLVVYFGAVLAFLAYAGLWFPFVTVLGIVFGVLLRDLSWLIGVQRTWPFVVRVTDWEKVQRIADGAEPDAAPNGGPATSVGNTGVTKGPPSVS